MRLLVVDDDPNIRRLMKVCLQEENYAVAEAANGREALDLCLSSPPDLIVLDVMLPEMDGWAFCREAKRIADIPIIMVTARGEMDDKLRGFGAGADDYLVKPFDPRELVVRVKALLRRFRIEHAQTVQVGDVSIDRRAYEVQIGDIAFLLPPKEFELLFKLASYPNRIFTRSQLIEQIWGIDYDGDERTVDVHIKRLRERLEGLSERVAIQTVRGLGYRLEVIA
ncbi:response regulator transcription factor [Paenibacillus thermoaerophilus]|jgi:two-component system OmpR family response regulator|uniref:Heme response regulator HssR n=1 Tax=Paenibacillus thermoaerophilus TaxID=1215385 RepID=A0ABW2V3M3_9BACL|nr:response regulator transcription factor [Paenibacillus thermoaerophilus]TMV18427.1 response regulator transcription factor [Paenibacillus thermoaerophilus]